MLARDSSQGIEHKFFVEQIIKMCDRDSYGLESIQKELLEALVEFDKICRKNRIHYALHGGTLLGAERNKRFIPWDDDADVSMKRSEYSRFKRVISNYSDVFELDEHSMWVPRLIMNSGNELVCIDIFVWDYISSNRVAQRIKITTLRFFQGMMKKNIEYNRFGFGYRVLLFVTHICGLAIPWDVKLGIYKYLCEHMLIGDKKHIHRANDNFVVVGDVYVSEYMQGYQNITLENYLFMVNKGYREFLERSYGSDYLTPPPQNKRIPMHEKTRGDLNSK